MDNKLTKSEEQALEQANQVWAMAESKGWQDYLLPHLEVKAKNSWLDPRQTKDKEAFFYNYGIAWAMAQSAKEIVDFVEGQIALAKSLEKKKKGEGDNKFRIGANNDQKK